MPDQTGGYGPAHLAAAEEIRSAAADGRTVERPEVAIAGLSDGVLVDLLVERKVLRLREGHDYGDVVEWGENAPNLMTDDDDD